MKILKKNLVKNKQKQIKNYLKENIYKNSPILKIKQINTLFFLITKIIMKIYSNKLKILIKQINKIVF